MSYRFPPDVEKVVRERMQSGEYSCEDDLLREAFKAMDDRTFVVAEEDPVVAEGVRRGLADRKAGRSQRLEEFDAEFRASRGISENA